MNAADRRRLTPVLGAVAVLLAILLIALWSGLGRGARWHDRAAAPRLPRTGATPVSPEVPPLEHFAEVWEKPLFSPTRTPEAVGEGDGAASGDLALTGVIMLPGLKMAILHDKTTGKDYRIVEGHAAGDGPALVELHPRSAVVDASGSRLQLQLQLVPGASPQAEGAPGNGAEPQPAPAEGNAEGGASGMVSRRDQQEAARAAMSGTGAASAAARARALKARIDAERRRAQRNGSG